MTVSTMKAENTIFMQMAAQGQTIYSAAGGVYTRETTWNASSGGGGGGVSSVWTIPSWRAVTGFDDATAG